MTSCCTIHPSIPRERILVAYGGQSVEHEISVITALQAMQSLDPTRYEVIPLYISPKGSWHTGTALFSRNFYKKWNENLSQTQALACLNTSQYPGLYPIYNQQVDLSSPLLIDVALMAFHGQYGEDGCLQGVFECAGIPYTSSPVAASAIAMNKHLCKSIVSKCGLRTLPSFLLTRENVRRQGLETHAHACLKVIEAAGFNPWPLFIKPNNKGSSIGVGKASHFNELKQAMAYALRFDHEVLIEPCIDKLLEINVSVLDDDPIRVSVVEIPVASDKILSYEDKYLRGGKNKTGSTPSQGMAGLTRKIDPHDLDIHIRHQAQEWAKKAFLEIGCSGVVRIDFMLDLASGHLYFNELNSIPGSLAFYLWEQSHPRLLYPELLEKLITRAKYRKDQSLCSERQIEFKALAKA
jgi:D-alanine-D-alanine ligase